MQILEYTTDDGASPFARWFDRLNAPAALKVRRSIAQIEAGNFANTKSIGGGVRERIIDFGPGYRVYFGRVGDTWVILLGVARRSASKRISTQQRPIGRTTKQSNGKAIRDGTNSTV